MRDLHGSWCSCVESEDELNVLSMNYCRSVTESCWTLCHPMECSIWAPLPPPSPGVCSDSCPLGQWCYRNISCSGDPFFCLDWISLSMIYQSSIIWLSSIYLYLCISYLIFIIYHLFSINHLLSIIYLVSIYLSSIYLHLSFLTNCSRY